MTDDGERLATLVRQQADGIDACEDAELHLLEQAVRARLELVGIDPGPDVALALMAVATFLGDHAPEWGGDVRAALAEVAFLGLRLLEDPPPRPTA